MLKSKFYLFSILLILNSSLLFSASVEQEKQLQHAIHCLEEVIWDHWLEAVRTALAALNAQGDDEV